MHRRSAPSQSHLIPVGGRVWLVPVLAGCVGNIAPSTSPLAAPAAQNGAGEAGTAGAPPADSGSGGSGGAAGQGRGGFAGAPGASHADAGPPSRTDAVDAGFADAHPPAPRDARELPDTRAPAPRTRPALVAVGYGGMRLLSTDGGLTWSKTAQDEASGGDDLDLVRAVAYGNGLWVVGGWNRWLVATDGRSWTERPHGYGIIQGLAFGNGVFLASTIDGVIYRSSDGLAWTRLGDAQTGKHTRLVFANGVFGAWGYESGRVRTSTDGVQWTDVPELRSAAYCGGTSFVSVQTCFGSDTAGLWTSEGRLRAEWRGIIARSPDGAAYEHVYQDQANSVEHFAAGLVPE